MYKHSLNILALCLVSYVSGNKYPFCENDNCYNEMIDARFTAVANTFCPEFLQGTTTAPQAIPSVFENCAQNVADVSSACSCITDAYHHLVYHRLVYHHLVYHHLQVVHSVYQFAPTRVFHIMLNRYNNTIYLAHGFFFTAGDFPKLNFHNHSSYDHIQPHGDQSQQHDDYKRTIVNVN
ncbi:hypothetical protein GQ53DRAFT_856637 [Thozetella sp. PMI_491]|nr:hypothetical protein GQ53DRAFT_856637 [Thozetella sp. PMI_491]